MKERIEEIRRLLVGRLDSNQLMDDIAYDFYERVEELKDTAPVFSQMLWEYESFLEYFKAANETLDDAETLLLKDMRLGIEETIQDAFDKAEDTTMEELLSSKWEPVIRKDFADQGITLYPGAPLSSDQIEELYVEAYRSFDRLHQQFLDKVLTLSPQKAYDQGSKRVVAFRRKNGLTLDEDDFLNLFDANFRKQELEKLLREKVQQVMKYSRHYELVLPEEDEVLEEKEEGSGESLEDIYDGIMEFDGDMREQPFTYVSQLMNEYTGRRVMPADDDWTEHSYWTTYADDFRDLILQFIETELDTMIEDLMENRREDYTALCRFLKLDDKSYKDLTQLLEHSDKINFGMAERVEDIWEAFCAEKI